MECSVYLETEYLSVPAHKPIIRAVIMYTPTCTGCNTKQPLCPAEPAEAAEEQAVLEGEQNDKGLSQLSS